MDALHDLTDGQLESLCSALQSGRLAHPYTVVSVKRSCVDPALGSEIVTALQEYSRIGMNSAQIASVVQAISQARKRCAASTHPVELFWTGPETMGVANRDTGVVVRGLFGIAEEEVLVAGFAVYQGQRVFQRLAKRMVERPTLRVRLFLNVHLASGDPAKSTEILEIFAHRFRAKEWPGERLPEVYYDPRSLEPDAAKRAVLHAKCVVADRRVALVTSANFTEAAQTRNIEVGALVRCGNFATNLTDHFEALVNVGALLRLKLER